MRATDPVIILEEAKFIWTHEEILDVGLLLLHLAEKNLI